MSIDFSVMKVGDEVKLPQGKWNDALREIHNLAADYAQSQNPRWQFEAYGHDGSDFERGQYYLKRIR